MADAVPKATLIQRLSDAHVVVMEALRKRQDALLVRVIGRMDRERAERIADDIKKTM